MSTGDPLVRVQSVQKHFTRGSERIEVLAGVNLEVPRGGALRFFPSASDPAGCGLRSTRRFQRLARGDCRSGGR